MSPSKVGRAVEVALSLALVASVLYGLSVTVVSGLLTGAARALGPGLFLVVLVSSVTAVCLSVMQRIGPVWATRAELQWREPFSLLRHRQRFAALVICAVAVVVGVIVSLGSHAGGIATIWGGPVSVLIVLLCAVLSYVGECLDACGWLQAGGASAGAITAAVLCHAAGWVPLLVLAATLVVAAALWSCEKHQRAGTGLRRARVPARWTLVRAGAVVEALRASVVMLDAAALQIVRDSQLSPTRARLPGREATIVLGRAITSRRVICVLPALPLAAGASAIWGAHVAATVLVIACFVFAWRSSALLDAYLEQPSLPRAYAPRGRFIPSLLAITTIALTGAYAIAGAVVASLPISAAVLCLGVALLGVLRRISGRHLAGEVGALISTPMGPVPVDLGQRVVAGSDALIVGGLIAFGGAGLITALVVLLAVPAYWVLFTVRGR